MMNTIETELKLFHLATSYTIGSYLLPGKIINSIREILQERIKVSILPSNEIIAGVKKGIFDLGLIESSLFDSNLIYKEWIDDELVICSKRPLPQFLGEKELKSCKLICRKENSLTRNFITGFLKKSNLSYKSFKSLSEINNTTAIIQSIKWSKPNLDYPTIAIMSKFAIQDELKHHELYQSRIGNNPMIRKFYLIYTKDKASDMDVKNIVEKLMEIFPIS